MPALIGMSNAAWKRQPSGLISVDPYWMSRSLLSCFISVKHGVLDVANNKIYSSTSVSQEIDQQGRTINFSSKVNINDFKQMTTTGGGLTALVWINPTNNQRAVFAQRTSNRNNHIELRTRSDNTSAALDNSIAFRANSDGNVGSNITWVAAEIPLDGRYYLIICRSIGLLNQIFSDGVFFSERLADSGITPSDFALGGLPDTTAISYDRSMRVAAFFDTALDDAEVFELSRNPWQLFAPAPSRFYLIPTAPALTIPTLSSPGVTDITATAARPQVTLTY